MTGSIETAEKPPLYPVGDELVRCFLYENGAVPEVVAPAAKEGVA